MESSSKGSVTPLASMFSVEEARRAAKRVEDSVSEKEEELSNIKHFISDNNNLINLVRRLPDELSHDVMVPFGKAAFFPGRLVHTNEFTVLLGEGYYAERTTKQTVEILKRRGKALETQVQSIKANIDDLRAEASFFESTATEALEGLVEIREDYVEDSYTQKQPKSDEKKVTVQDDEYSRMMARLDELEREELAAEGADDGDEDEDEDEDENGEGEGEGEGESNTDESDQDDQISPIKIDESNLEQIMKPKQVTKDEKIAADALSRDYQHRLNITDESNCTGLTIQPLAEDGLSEGKSLSHYAENSHSASRNSMFPEVKEKTGAASLSRNEVPMQTKSGSILDHFPHNQEQSESSLQKLSQSSRPSTSGFDSSKAFTGSIVEHSHNLPPPSQGQNATSSQPSKPVSRFKMQRR